MTFHPSSLRKSLRNASLIFVAGLFFGGCASFEPGAPVAAVTVRASSRFDVMGVLERVFRDAGYRVASQTFDSATFDRDGTRMDTVMHGNWIGGTVAERALVVIADRGDGRYRIRCTPQIVRNPDDDAFEDAHRRLQLVSFHYSGLLGKVKKEFR